MLTKEQIETYESDGFREGVLELHKHYKSDSFFGVQGQKSMQKETKS